MGLMLANFNKHLGSVKNFYYIHILFFLSSQFSYSNYELLAINNSLTVIIVKQGKKEPLKDLG